ncbi:MAG TPA: BACON domain-containing carbohydrate-binding protein [Gemmatimonadales bacterium]|nr:BACON domain-containing carbohydrate-binding protein [Gemmatimonadales bacterium]
MKTRLAIVLLTLLAACRLDMLLKSTTTPHSQLAVAPTEVHDSVNAGSRDVRQATVSITNTGGGSMSWSASDHSDWIHLDPHSGDVPGTLTIELDPNDLGPGVYEGDVTVIAKTAGDSQFTTIPVTFVVLKPGLSVSPVTLEHSTNVNSNATFSDNIQITNTGTGALNWSAAKSKSWLTLGTTSGTGNGSIPVQINTAGLLGGTYHDDIVITAPGAAGSPARVGVTLTIFAPGLAVTPGIVTDTAAAGATAPSPHTLHVSNSGTGTITWTATKSQPWVTLSTVAGGAPEDVVVTLNPTGLPPGVQTDTIVFTSAEAPTGPVMIPVQFTILQPGLSVAPPSINASAESNDNKKQTFDLAITNTAGGPLAWFASSDQPWITLSALGGLTPATLRVTLDPGGLPAGTNVGNVTVSSPTAAPVVVPVQLIITQKACTAIALTLDVVRTGTLDTSDCDAPHRPNSYANVYSFGAAAGDTLSMRMTATFDAYLIFSDFAGNVLAQNDECPGELGTSCIREFPITTTGTYFIEATSAAPRATGSLTLTIVRERPPSAPTSMGQFRADGSSIIQPGDTIPENNVVFKAKVDDPNASDQVRLEVELEPLGFGFRNAPTQVGDFVSASGSGSATSVHAGGLTSGTQYHWQARTCDRTSRCSGWAAFGGNAETAADFTVVVPPGGSPVRQP